MRPLIAAPPSALIYLTVHCSALIRDPSCVNEEQNIPFKKIVFRKAGIFHTPCFWEMSRWNDSSVSRMIHRESQLMIGMSNFVVEVVCRANSPKHLNCEIHVMLCPFAWFFFENVAQTKRTNFKKSTWNFSFSLFFWHCIRCWPNWLIGVQVLLAVMLARVCRQVRSGYVKVLMLIRHNARHVRRLSFTC